MCLPLPATSSPQNLQLASHKKETQLASPYHSRSSQHQTTPHHTPRITQDQKDRREGKNEKKEEQKKRKK
jgi:hypothetical protein